MNVTRESPVTGEINTMDLPITQAQLDELASPRRRLVQEIFPDLNAAQREFLKTGYTQEDWDALFDDARLFVVDGNPSCNYLAMLRANLGDAALRDWLRTAKPGDRFPDGAGCECIANPNAEAGSL